jgi:quercetin dioxygenase-like cupin family protein
MSFNPKQSRRRDIAVSSCVAIALALVVMGTQNDISFAQSSNFQGGAPEVTEGPDDARYIRILFPAGVRSSWHSHTWGQLLMIEEGIGLHQIRGRTIEEFHPGEPFWTPAGIEHWHGAHPDVDALQLTIYQGTVNWLDATTDEQYNGARMRPMSRSSN